MLANASPLLISTNAQRIRALNLLYTKEYFLLDQRLNNNTSMNIKQK